jgi:cell wall-associated NlpC family hydrolase
MTVWAPYLDVKLQPSVQSPTIACCTRGGLLGQFPEEQVTEDGFIPVGLPDGTKGFTRASCLAKQVTKANTANEDQFRAEIVGVAKLYLGVQYRWGGKTPLGIDCSGFTSMVYLLAGSIIYRDADIRPGFEMREIPYEDRKPGDLIFFKGHVAMFAGADYIIHSTAHKLAIGVVINSLDSKNPLYREDLAKSIVKTGTIF